MSVEMSNSSAMDWALTSPPSILVFDPYSNLNYVPGGWPESPPPFSSQKRKRSQDEDEEVRQTFPAVKRACTKFIACKDSAVATSHGIAKAAFLASSTTYRFGIGAWEIVRIVRRRYNRPRRAAAEKSLVSQNNSAFARMKRSASIRKQTTKSWLIALEEQRASLHKKLKPEIVQQYANADQTKMPSANYLRARAAFAQAPTKPPQFPLTPEPEEITEDVPRYHDSIPETSYLRYMPVLRPSIQTAPAVSESPPKGCLLFIPRLMTPAPEMDGVQYAQDEGLKGFVRHEENQDAFESEEMDHNSNDDEEAVHYATDMDHDSNEDATTTVPIHYNTEMDEDIEPIRARKANGHAIRMDQHPIEAMRVAAPINYATHMEHDSNEDKEAREGIIEIEDNQYDMLQPGDMVTSVEPARTRQHVIPELESHSTRDTFILRDQPTHTPSDKSDTTYPDDSPSRQLQAELEAALLQSVESDMSPEDDHYDSHSELGATTEEELDEDNRDESDVSDQSEVEEELDEANEVVELDGSDADAEEADIDTISEIHLKENDPAWVKATVKFAPEVTVIPGEHQVKKDNVQTGPTIKSPKYEPPFLTPLPSTSTGTTSAPIEIQITGLDKQITLPQATNLPKTPTKSQTEHQRVSDHNVINITDSDEKLAPVDEIAALSIKDESPIKPATPKTPFHHEEATRRRTRRRVLQEQAALEALNEYEIVPLSDEWDRKVRDAVRKGHGNYQASDFARVVPQYASRGQDNWLNDEAINGYLTIIAQHGKKNDRPTQTPSHHALSSFFYTKLRERTGPEGTARWTKRAKIGGKALLDVDKVFVPINKSAHWTLGLVQPKKRIISHYDSLRSASRGIEVCNDLMNWVKFELGSSFNEDEWNIEPNGKSSQQTNSDDCGLFSITNARQIMLGLDSTSFLPSEVGIQRKRVVAELVAGRLLKSKEE